MAVISAWLLVIAVSTPLLATARDSPGLIRTDLRPDAIPVRLLPPGALEAEFELQASHSTPSTPFSGCYTFLFACQHT